MKDCGVKGQKYKSQVSTKLFLLNLNDKMNHNVNKNKNSNNSSNSLAADKNIEK